MSISDYKPKIILWAMSIQAREGYNKPSASNLWRGSRSWRNHNPGNLRFSVYSSSLGGLTYDMGGFAIFPDYTTGFCALCQLLTDACNGKLKSYNPQGNLFDFYAAYAPSSDGNDPISYANFVHQHTGIELNVPISSFVL